MTDTEKTLRESFHAINAVHAQKIREAYYKAVEGLRTLVLRSDLGCARADRATVGVGLWPSTGHAQSRSVGD
jgi:hypothetical protein